MEDKHSKKMLMDNILQGLRNDLETGINKNEAEKGEHLQHIIRRLGKIATQSGPLTKEQAVMLEDMIKTVRTVRNEAQERGETLKGTNKESIEACNKINHGQELTFADVKYHFAVTCETLERNVEESEALEAKEGGFTPNGYFVEFQKEFNEKLTKFMELITSYRNSGRCSEECYETIKEDVKKMRFDIEDIVRSSQISVEKLKELVLNARENGMNQLQGLEEMMQNPEHENDGMQTLEQTSNESLEQEKTDELTQEDKVLTIGNISELMTDSEKTDIRNRFMNRSMQTLKSGEREFLVINEPSMNDGQMQEKGRIATPDAVIYLCFTTLEDEENEVLYQHVENNTITYMTIKEAKEMGFVKEERKRKDRDDGEVTTLE